VPIIIEVVLLPVDNEAFTEARVLELSILNLDLGSSFTDVCVEERIVVNHSSFIPSEVHELDILVLNTDERLVVGQEVLKSAVYKVQLGSPIIACHKFWQ